MSIKSKTQGWAEWISSAPAEKFSASARHRLLERLSDSPARATNCPACGVIAPVVTEAATVIVACAACGMISHGKVVVELVPSGAAK